MLPESFGLTRTLDEFGMPPPEEELGLIFPPPDPRLLCDFLTVSRTGPHAGQAESLHFR